ncbi:hypothetical protein F4779DRAFT_616613 [Xylariaceae sp. FL0662B]|nr:hypothetical protein F4779DRAFT_616613 [Xylariaceae sp. FL0662B]
MGADHQDLRNALIKTHLALLQREVREKHDWYTTPRVVIRKRNGKIQLSRLGARQTYASRNGHAPIDGGGSPASDYGVIDGPLSPIRSFV